MSVFAAEFLGTFLLMLLGNGVNANVCLSKTKGHNSGWIVITVGWGLAVFAGVALAAPYSGAHINPAVTVALAFAGELSWTDVPIYVCAQMLGSAAGAFAVWLAYRDHFRATEDASAILACFSTSPAIPSRLNNFVTEAIGTFVLVLLVFYFAGASISGEGLEDAVIGLGSIGALPVALLVVVIGMALGGPTGYAINPARDLAPRIMHAILPIRHKGDSDWSYSWIPVLGPITGGLLAAILYLGISAV